MLIKTVPKIILATLIVFLMSIFHVNAILDNDLVAYYGFEFGHPPLDDYTIYGYDLTSHGNATLDTSGIIDDAYNFDGTNSYLNGTNLMSLPTQFSINFWINASDTSTHSRPVWFWESSNDQLGIEIVGGNIYATRRLSATTKQIGTSFTDTADYHMITMVVDPNLELVLYVDGAEVNRIAVASDVLTNGNFNLGRSPEPFGYFNGEIDEVSIWNRSLYSYEISDLYNNGNGITYPFPIDYELGISYVLANNQTLVNGTVFNTTDINFTAVGFKHGDTNRSYSLTTLGTDLITGVEDFGGTYDAILDGFFLFGGDNGGGSRDFIKFYNKTAGTIDENYSQLPFEYFTGSEACINRRDTSEHYCYGGRRSQNTTNFNHIMKFDSVANTTEFLTETLPAERYDGCAVYDKDRDSVYYFGGFNYSQAHDDIYIHDLNSNTVSTSSVTLDVPLVLSGCWFDEVNDYAVITAGTEGIAPATYDNYRGTQLYYPSNDTLVILGNESNFPVNADSLNCEYMPIDNGAYCFGGVTSSLIAPAYYYDIFRWDSENLFWSIIPNTIIYPTDDFPAMLDWWAGDTIYMFGVQSGAPDNDVTKMIKNQKFSVSNNFVNASWYQTLDNESPLKSFGNDTGIASFVYNNLSNGSHILDISFFDPFKSIFVQYNFSIFVAPEPPAPTPETYIVNIIEPYNGQVFDLDSASETINFTLNHNSTTIKTCDYYIDGVKVDGASVVSASPDTNYTKSFIDWSDKSYTFIGNCYNSTQSVNSTTINFNVNLPVVGDGGEFAGGFTDTQIIDFSDPSQTAEDTLGFFENFILFSLNYLVPFAILIILLLIAMAIFIMVA